MYGLSIHIVSVYSSVMFRLDDLTRISALLRSPDIVIRANVDVYSSISIRGVLPNIYYTYMLWIHL